MSSTATPPSTGPYQQSLPKGTELTAASGRSYMINEIIYERSRGPLLCCLYRAGHEGKEYILKDILPGDFQYNLDLQKLVSSAHIRTLIDSIPDRRMLVFPFIQYDLQTINTAAIPPSTKKMILRDALAGLSDLHDKNIYHTDIKPSNIMMDTFKQSNGTIGFRNVQITDLEEAFLIPPKSRGLGKRLSGNPFWRSPEAWARGAQHTPADIFSFGIVAIYVWLDRMILYSDEANEAEDPSDMILRRHVSYFINDVDDFNGFIDYHGGEEDPFVNRFGGLLMSFNAEDKREPWTAWQPVDPQFKDLICKMTYLDPRRRITAREALQHPWFNE
ncbi:kinase-like domain-containing protein [Chaetomium fimeti]|uniref:Kinase-like domain-containing protein n=1 Tax=Chaetomium fimeti TaxID=1854472 RepID=A0AAE0LSR4_9PEZI|nr:kinase-like domain-containing protein [Chaetomium fimeti]